MSFLVPIAIFGWIPVCVMLFACMPARRAVFTGYLFAWMFLPMAGYDLPGLPDFGKSQAASFGVLLGILIYDSNRLFAFRPSIWDLPVLGICVTPFFTSMSNGLGVYDGLSSMVGSTSIWLIPYLVGRIYLKNQSDFLELAKYIFIGGLIYLPLCLIEIRLSPQFHVWVYGFRQHSFLQAMRYDGYRPMVFMQHGLAVAFWMASATVCGFWLWRSGVMHRFWGVPMALIMPVLAVTTVLCKSMGSICLMLIGCGLFYVTRRLPLGQIVLIAVLCFPILWIGGRATGVWSGDLIHSLVSQVDEDRAGSLKARMIQEDLFSDKAWRRPAFGWGGWMRMFPVDADGRRLTRGIDGMWVIHFGKNGLLGLISFVCVMLLGAIRLVAVRKTDAYRAPSKMPGTLFLVLASLYMVDCLFNAMTNPLFVIAAAGLGNLAWAEARSRRSRMPQLAQVQHLST